MSLRSSVLLILGLSIGFSASAQGRSSSAGSDATRLYFDETFFPVYVNKNDTQSVTTAPGVATESGLGYDFRTTLGYSIAGSVLVGFTYDIYHLNTKRAAINGGDDSLNETSDRSELGPTLGYINSGWRLLVTYFLSGSQTVHTKNADATGSATGDVTFKKTNMTGFQISGGYTFAMGGGFELGPSLVYRTVTYAKQSKVNALSPAENYSSTQLYSKAVDATLSPMVTLVFRF